MDRRIVSKISVRLVFETEQIQTYGAYAGDLNGDGHVDIASANSCSNHASVLFGDGTGASDYPAGLYIIRASSGRQIVSKPIVFSQTDLIR